MVYTTWARTATPGSLRYTVATLHTTGVNGDLGLVGGFRSNAFPQAVVNPATGDLYVVFDDKGNGTDHTEVFFTLSTDG